MRNGQALGSVLLSAAPGAEQPKQKRAKKATPVAVETPVLQQDSFDDTRDDSKESAQL